jgi:hypothetical protein
MASGATTPATAQPHVTTSGRPSSRPTRHRSSEPNAGGGGRCSAEGGARPSGPALGPTGSDVAVLPPRGLHDRGDQLGDPAFQPPKRPTPPRHTGPGAKADLQHLKF